MIQPPQWISSGLLGCLVNVLKKLLDQVPGSFSRDHPGSLRMGRLLSRAQMGSYLHDHRSTLWIILLAGDWQ
jgi:hypothetical protein